MFCEFGERIGVVLMPCLELVLMIMPGCSRSIMQGAKTCVPWITPHRFTASTVADGRWRSMPLRSGYAPAVQLTQFRQFGDQRHGDDRSREALVGTTLYALQRLH